MNRTPRQSIPEQPPQTRVSNFQEVALGYTEEQALLEASRCLNCKNPKCVEGCPVNVQIPLFIHQITQKQYSESVHTIQETNAFPAVCGRVCPQENQCEGRCVLGVRSEPVAIGRLERFVADYDRKRKTPSVPSNILNNFPIRVAVIGSGPAGLTCAADLAKAGFQVDLFEAFHQTGGVLMYGIPEFRLPKDIVKSEIDAIRQLGVQFHLNSVIGRLWKIDELFAQGFKAVFIGVGAGLPAFMQIPGEDLSGVYSANEFLTRINLMKAYLFPQTDTPVKIGQRVAVVGGGNVAMDSARSAKRLGADVYLIYRRSEDEMPARKEESHHAKEEGIQFFFLTNPVKINSDDRHFVKSISCTKMALGEPDQSGRRSPIEIPDSLFDLEVDSVIMAIGNKPNPLLTQNTPHLNLNKRGNISIVNESGLTSIPHVWAGGDIVTGAATVIEAMGAGKKAAKAIIETFLPTA